jgi:hypothetical protein
MRDTMESRTFGPGSSLRDLYRAREGRRLRESSFDRTGGNKDFYVIRPGERKDILSIEGAGIVTHIWMTLGPMVDDEEAFTHRKIALRMFWDGETTPSVEAPIGDFFGMGHGMTRNFVSAPLAMSPQDGRAMNCFFPMPFAEGARIEVESGCDRPLKCYFYVDYELHGRAPEDALRFHALWRRERTDGIEDGKLDNARFEFGGKNVTGDGNYVILDATGRGHYVGCNLNIHNLRFTHEWNWYGEGDDMIFIDGEKWPPSLHGTGMEDYFSTAWCPTQPYSSPYHGIILGGGDNWSGKVSFYRYHIEDPVMFSKSIRVTIEHGHNNRRSDDYSSTAYWYQDEPHGTRAALPPATARLPLPDQLPFDSDSMKECFDY